MNLFKWTLIHQQIYRCANENLQDSIRTSESVPPQLPARKVPAISIGTPSTDDETPSAVLQTLATDTHLEPHSHDVCLKPCCRDPVDSCQFQPVDMLFDELLSTQPLVANVWWAWHGRFAASALITDANLNLQTHTAIIFIDYRSMPANSRGQWLMLSDCR